jgi:hypothetical protein
MARHQPLSFVFEKRARKKIDSESWRQVDPAAAQLDSRPRPREELGEGANDPQGARPQRVQNFVRGL